MQRLKMESGSAWNKIWVPQMIDSTRKEPRACVGSSKNRTTAAMAVLGSVIAFRQTAAGLSEANEHLEDLQQTGVRREASRDIEPSCPAQDRRYDRTLKLANVSWSFCHSLLHWLVQPFGACP